jgi:hypothetical protein
MATPFSIEGTLNLPGTPGLPADPLPFGLSSSYESKAEFEYNLPAGAGSKVVDFGTMPVAGAKAVLVVYEPKNGAPVVAVTLNGSNQPIELSPGGFFVLGSPAPAAGITSMSITYTGAGRVRGWLLG